MRVVFALSSSPLVMALVMLLIISNSVGSTNLYPSPPPNNSPVSNVTSLLPAPKDHHNSPPPAYSDLHNHPNTFTVVGNIYSHLSYDRMKSSNYSLNGATVKVTCMAGDKEIVGYGKAKINGKYNITIKGYNYSKFGGNGCKAKLIYFAPIEKGSPLNKTTDVRNSKNGTKLEVKSSGAYNDVLFQSKSFRNKNENLSINPQAPGNPSAIAYYKLVLQWPTGVCSGVGKKCKKSPWPGYFTIHGLWEGIKSTSRAQHSSDQFDSTKLIGLKKDLKSSWPTLELNTDEDFWKHEWERHGVKSELGLVGYFQETLSLYKKVTALLSKGLAAEKIYPDGGKLYSLQSIETALHFTGNKGIVTCVQHKTLNMQQIQEITFNFTPGLKQQDIVGVSSCTEKFIRFPI